MQALKISRCLKLYTQITAYPQIMRPLFPCFLWITVLVTGTSSVFAQITTAKMTNAPIADALITGASITEAPTTSSQMPTILVSIAPLATLVKDLWPEAKVRVLIAGSEDFHHFQWQPVQLARLQQADWVVWLGAHQEPALVSTLQRLPASKVITLFANHPERVADQPAPAQPDEIHLWLDPLAVTKMLSILGERWQKTSQAHQQQQIQQQFWQNWQARLLSLGKRPFAIQHDAISSWVQFFGLTQTLAITSDHEHEPGVQQLWNMRQQLQHSPIVCYLQTQSLDPWWPKISTHLAPPIKTATLDLFSASDYPLVDQSYYLGFIQQNLEKLENCLR